MYIILKAYLKIIYYFFLNIKNMYFLFFYIFILLLVNIFSFNKDNETINQTINSLITNGDFLSLDKYLENLLKENISFIDILSLNINKKLEKIKEVSKKLSVISRTNFRVISPAFNWRETEFELYLEIFYSHRMNAPSCGELDYENVTLLNNNLTFHFEGNCTMGDDELFFNLTLNLFKAIRNIRRIEKSRKKMTITLLKEYNSYWNRLLDNEQENPENMNSF
jgi:hypothetical protein